jgi:phosphatidylglycerophosphatase A
MAPGTAGAVVGVALFLLLSRLSLPLYALTLVTLACLGVWVSDAALRFFRCPDDRRIVIDEVVGQLLALAPLVAGSEAALSAGSRWALVVTGFVTFRVFDVWKPGPVRWAESHLEGGVGVMADDLVAGALAALLLGGAVAVLAGGVA